MTIYGVFFVLISWNNELKDYWYMTKVYHVIGFKSVSNIASF